MKKPNSYNGRTTAKELALLAVMTALLIAGQLALSQISGVEIVTVLLLTFSYGMGPKRGFLVGLAFSILRCFLFGFFLSVVVLYLLYFPLFGALWGGIGRKARALPLWQIVLLACFCTVCFTLLDDLLAPLLLGFGRRQTLLYWKFSLAAVIPQTVCTAVTVGVLFAPLAKIFKTFAKKI